MSRFLLVFFLACCTLIHPPPSLCRLGLCRKKAFEIFDKDGNGHITPRELREVMRQLGSNVTEEELSLLIAAADTD